MFILLQAVMLFIFFFDVTTEPELINNIDISIILMFVVRNTLKKTRKGSYWTLSLWKLDPNPNTSARGLPAGEGPRKPVHHPGPNAVQ